MLCPICSNEFTNPFPDRYPRAICAECTNTCIDVNNCKVKYGNRSIAGGFISYHATPDGVIEREDHVCYVNGAKCFADECRYGGIVIIFL